MASNDAMEAASNPSIQQPPQDITTESQKPVHTIILDSSPLLLNTPPISTLLANSHSLVTLPSVISEIRDQSARDRVETLYKPFLNLRTPKPDSVKFVKEFAKKTGDGAVLSKTDIEVLALAYDLECERNGGDWRLRRVPGQKRCNGSPPKRDANAKPESTEVVSTTAILPRETEAVPQKLESLNLHDNHQETKVEDEPQTQELHENENTLLKEETLDNRPQSNPLLVEEQIQSDSDSEGWITPSNIKTHQAQDQAGANSTGSNPPTTMQVATITGDFAMQNVLLQMNLNLLSPATCKRIGHIKQTILRCHGCFATTKEMDRQFCARCGKPTLTRVSCTTNDKGEVKLHLKANMQWNNKGNVFSIPKPTSGSANQKWQGPRQGGGQKGWGNNLILAEDQKEYVRATTTQQRTRAKDLMDEDYLPNILTGDRDRGGGRVRVGAGRNINARKR